MYAGGFPKKKLLTPAPNLTFDGSLAFGGERWEIEGWVGLRGHNWGTEHAHSYAYGAVNLWDDGPAGRDRVVEGFSAQIKLGARKSPWLTAVVGRDPDVRRNRLRHWLGAGSVELDRWSARWRRPRNGAWLQMTADPRSYAGLRYDHPDGRQSYCYNTKFADVRWAVGDRRFTSRCGELEVLLPTPDPQIPLHPAEGWEPSQGDYRSAGD